MGVNGLMPMCGGVGDVVRPVASFGFVCGDVWFSLCGLWFE